MASCQQVIQKEREKQPVPLGLKLFLLVFPLRHGQAKPGGKAFRNREELERELTSCVGVSVAREPLCPREARVGTLRARKDHFRFAGRNCGRRRQAHLDMLVSHELHAGASMDPATPILPEERLMSNHERM